MKKLLHHFLSMSLLVMVLVSCESPRKNAKVEQGNYQQKNEQLPKERSKDDHMLVGYNAPAIFYQFRNGQPSKEIINLYRQLDPEIMRFPGGTLANHYRFSKPGYGRDLVADNAYKENFIYDFIALMKQVMDEPRVIYVMNFFEHFGNNPVDEEELITENMNAIKTLQENGIIVHAVELGNELYIYPEITNNWFKKKEGLEKLSGENVAEYLRLAEKYTLLIKAYNPEIKVGLPMGKFANPLHKYWNEQLLTAKFTDAYICHFYGQVKGNCKQASCFREQVEQYMRKMTRDILTIKKRTGKEIWVTEWNAINFGFSGDANLSFAHTDLHVEYNKKFMDIFERSGVEICNYHRISGSSKKPAYNLISVNDDYSCETHSTYDAFRKNK